MLILPPSMEDFIDPNHPVRVVNQVIDTIGSVVCSTRITIPLTGVGVIV